jgi:multiple sugar transport system ATP-binding protein
MAQVVIEQLSKTFSGTRGERVPAVTDLSFQVEDRELLVLVGPSGCGKTTTLRLLAGLEDPSGGVIRMDGKVINDVPPGKRDIAMVFQNHALYPHMSAHENMAFGLKVRKCSNAEIERRVHEAAEMLGLNDCLTRKPAALSGGQRQRVALGRALVLRPKLFLLDEPLSNLDPQTRAELRTEIARLHRRLEVPMIYVTHDQTEAMTLGDRIGVMRQGSLRQLAAPLEVYRHPADLFVAGFIGSPPMNFFPGTMSGEKGALCFISESEAAKECSAPFQIALPPALSNKLAGQAAEKVILGLRPEDIHAQNSTGAAQPGAIRAVIESIQCTGSETCLSLACAGKTIVVRVGAAHDYRVGQTLLLTFRMEQTHFFDSVTEKCILD